MRRTFLILAVVLLAVLPPVVAGAASGTSTGSTGSAAAREVVAPAGPAPLSPGVSALVERARPGALLDLVVSLDRPADAGLKATLARLGVWSHAFEEVPAAGVRLPLDRLDALRSTPGVIGVYDEHPLHYFLKESAKLNNTGRAWQDLGVTGKGVTVAILDTGVDFTHPDLAPAMKANVKLIGFGSGVPVVPVAGIPNSDTSSGHGTHVAGDVAGRGTASHGEQKGMAYGADLVGIGTGDGLSIFTALEGFDWLLQNREKYGIKVVNNSYGTGFGPFDPMDPISLATKKATDVGIVVVFANGNDGDEMSMNPYAAAPWVLPVAAGSKSGKVTDFSSGGIEADTVGMQFAKADIAGETRSPLHMGLYHPAVTTTGEDVVSTRSNTTITPLTALPGDVRSLPPDQLPYYHTLSGTSMASPETAGVAALLLEANPALTPAQVRMALQITARQIPGEPFYKQGYGYTDASAGVELVRGLKGRPVEEITAALETRQAARDQAILDTLAHPSRTYAYTERGPLLAGKLTHKAVVPAGSERIKVLSNGGSLPFVGGTSYDITVKDAAGKEVGTISASAASGTTALDLDLRKLDPDETKADARYGTLAFGDWTVDIGAVGSLVPPMDFGPIDDALQKRFITSLISVFGVQPRPCRSTTEFIPGSTVQYRLQDDASKGVGSFPANPEYTYVGPLPDGTLGTRTPARKLAATFGQLETAGRAPEFSTPALSAPMTLGGDAELVTWIQGPGETAAGILSGELVDVAPDGALAIIGKTPAGVAAKATTAAPVETRVPIPVAVPHTVPVGHRLALRLRISFVGTSAHTLFYDSDKYATGVTLRTGAVAHQDCAPAGLLPT